MKKDAHDMNIFMMCEKLNTKALSEMPDGYTIRNPRPDELGLWKRIQFDDAETADRYMDFMTDYYNRVYAPKGDLFFKTCLFAVDNNDKPVGTCFAWKAYDEFTTIHWYKVLKPYKGRGIGRALLSHVMSKIPQQDYPVFLHTQTGSFRAIKLYSDFGFVLLKDKKVGMRENQLKAGLPLIKEWMPRTAFENLKFGYAPKAFLKVVAEHETDDF